MADRLSGRFLNRLWNVALNDALSWGETGQWSNPGDDAASRTAIVVEKGAVPRLRPTGINSSRQPGGNELHATSTNRAGSPSVAVCCSAPLPSGISSHSIDGVAVVSAGAGALPAEFLDWIGVGAAVVRSQAVPDKKAGCVPVAVEVDTPGGRQPCLSAPILVGDLRRRRVPARLVRAIIPDVATSRPAGQSDDERKTVVVEPQAAELLRAPAGAVSSIALLCHAEPADTEPCRDGEHESVLAALRAWCAAVGPRRLLLAGPRSFCTGVERAIEIVERAPVRYGSPPYVRKQIVYNVLVVCDLER